MLTNSQIMERVDAAIKAMSVADLGQSVLQPEKANFFIDEVQKATPLLMDARRVNMMNPTRDIDRIGFTTRILNAPAQLEANDTNDAAPGTNTNRLTAEEVMGAAGLKYDTLEENIEREGFEDHLLRLMAEQAARDLEELYINGDTGSGTPFLALINGWLQKAANSVTGVASADFDPTDIEAAMEAALQAIPDKYLRDPADWRYYMPWSMSNAWRDSLKTRGTALGDETLTRGTVPPYKGIGVVTTPNMPAGTLLLAPPDNLVYGIFREIRVEPDRQPRKRQVDFILTLRTDCHFEDENAVCVADGYTG